MRSIIIGVEIAYLGGLTDEVGDDAAIAPSTGRPGEVVDAVRWEIGVRRVGQCGRVLAGVHHGCPEHEQEWGAASPLDKMPMYREAAGMLIFFLSMPILCSDCEP